MRLAAAPAAIVITLGIAVALAAAGEGQSFELRRPLLRSDSDRVKTDVGTYCVTEEHRPGQGYASVCADAAAPTKPPTPRLTVSRGEKLLVRFRDRRGLADEVTGFSARLVRLHRRRIPDLAGPALEPTRVPERKRRWTVRLPANLHRADALSISAPLESGDANFIAGLRRVKSEHPPTICPFTGGRAFDTAKLVGLALDEAERLAARYECTVRAVEIDGVPQAGTSDYRADRVNVVLDDGRVTRVDGVG